MDTILSTKFTQPRDHLIPVGMRALALLRGDGDPAQLASDPRWRSYGRELLRAGIVLADGVARRQADGVRAPGADRRSSNDAPGVIGFWIWELSTLEEASEWARRAPSPSGRSFIEVVPLGPPLLVAYGLEEDDVAEDG